MNKTFFVLIRPWKIYDKNGLIYKHDECHIGLVTNDTIVILLAW
jgi:hypothetical protein